MANHTNAQPHPDPAEYPRAANDAFTPYALTFDEFAEPRTIPSQWDLSGLLVPDGRSDGAGTRGQGESPSTDRAGG